MQIYRSEGVILETINFQDYDQIITVFTLEEGLIKLIVKNANSFRAKKGAVLAPLTKAEFIYKKGKSNIWKCQEVSLIKTHLELRQNLAWLEAGCGLMRAILSSQMEHKPAPDLYRLLTSYLAKAHEIQPEALLSSFILKILRHEGLFVPLAYCAACLQPMDSVYVADGESYCKKDAPSLDLCFEKEELNILHHLAFCLSFSALKEAKIHPVLTKKIRFLFDSCI